MTGRICGRSRAAASALRMRAPLYEQMRLFYQQDPAARSAAAGPAAIGGGPAPS
jgi:hypothetical protein